jgi:hypothetical protein
MIGTAPICEDCLHFQPEVGNFKCAAFPDGIPEEVLDGSVDHHEPYNGDHGIQFEPALARA